MMFKLFYRKLKKYVFGGVRLRAAYIKYIFYFKTSDYLLNVLCEKKTLEYDVNVLELIMKSCEKYQRYCDRYLAFFKKINYF